MMIEANREHGCGLASIEDGETRRWVGLVWQSQWWDILYFLFY